MKQIIDDLPYINTVEANSTVCQLYPFNISPALEMSHLNQEQPATCIIQMYFKLGRGCMLGPWAWMSHIQHTT